MTPKFFHLFRSKKPKDIEPTAGAVSHTSISRKCIKAIPRPFRNPTYLPLCSQRHFLTQERIQRTLTSSKRTRPRDLQPLIDYVMMKASRIFLTLVYIEKAESIDIFYRNNFTDNDLPLYFDDDYKIFSYGQPTETRNTSDYLPDWTTGQMEHFQEKQWIFLAPSLPDGEFSPNLKPEHPLPFKIPPSTSTVTSNGRFGTVYKITIPGLHFNDTNTLDYEVALKHLDIPDGDEKDKFFDRERETLKTMRELEHPHLIRAHSAYERGTDKGFVFPYAEGGDLARYWKSRDFPELDLDAINWALIQIRGLVDGIKKLHDTNTRHGDIKPQNILIFNDRENSRGHLVIADVGIAKYHALYTNERYRTVSTKFASRRYEPPEVEGVQLPTSRRYDLWSLGCVLLEFIIWLDSGSQGLSDFLRDSIRNRGNDRFWENGLVLPIITRRMDALENKLTRKGQQYFALMEIVIVIRMRLLVELDDRATSAELLEIIDEVRSRYPVSRRGPRDHQPRCKSIKENQVANIAQGTNAHLSRNTAFNNEWRVKYDDTRSREMLSQLQLGVSFSDPPSVLCQACKAFDLTATEIILDRGTEQLREGSDACCLCKLLSDCFSKRNISFKGPFRLIRDHSTLKVSKTGLPLLSVYSRPDLKVDYAQAGLPVLPKFGSQEQFNLLREWIRFCDKTHKCSTYTPDRMPSRIIDVGQCCDQYVHLTTRSRAPVDKYVALSHCWGQARQQPTRSGQQDFDGFTEKRNVEAFKRGINYSRLPRTFQDAVRTTRALGIRYLWIDSLCIIQDDQDDWESESKEMGNVYSSAYVTIAASSSSSSLDGFLVDRPSRAIVTIVTSDGPVYLAEAIDNFKDDVEGGVLNTRGWVLQERALSRRTIHFTSTQIYWECGKGIQCETLAQLISPPLSMFLGDNNFPTVGLKHFKNQRIEFIQYLYTDYSARKLTKQTDRPIAISALQRRIGYTFGSKVSHGIIWRYFERSILWRARVTRSMSRIGYVDNYAVPSWSWMAYSGEIDYMEVPFGKVEWANELKNPYEYTFKDQSENEDSHTPVLSAMARSLMIEGPDLFGRITLDMDVKADFDKARWKCVLVGKGKLSHKDNHYVLLIRPASNMSSKYERIGVGVLLASHFSDDGGEPVSLI